MARTRKTLSPEQEAQALQLKEKLQHVFDDELLEIAQTLVSTLEAIRERRNPPHTEVGMNSESV